MIPPHRHEAECGTAGAFLFFFLAAPTKPSTKHSFRREMPGTYKAAERKHFGGIKQGKGGKGEKLDGKISTFRLSQENREVRKEDRALRTERWKHPEGGSKDDLPMDQNQLHPHFATQLGNSETGS